MIELLFLLMIIGGIGLGLVGWGLVSAARDRQAWHARREQAGYLAPGDEFQLMTVPIPPDGGVYAWRPNGAPCRICECPPGPLIHKGEFAIKANGHDHAFVLITGDVITVWQNNMDAIVQPITLDPVDPDPFWIEEQ